MNSIGNRIFTHRLILPMTVVLAIGFCSIALPPLSAAEETQNPPGFIETLDKLKITPEQRVLAMKQKYWVKELGVGMNQEEADALYKLWKNPGRIKFACMAPMGTTWAKYIRDVPKLFLEEVGEEIIQLDSYIGLSLGNDPDYVRKMASGALESAGMTSWGMKYICQEMGVYELPFLFDTYGEADYVMRQTWPYFVQKFAEKGFTLVPTSFEVGFLQLFSTNTTVKRPEDLKNTKYASWMGDVEIAAMQQLGVNPVVITVTEVPSSLATGVIQAGSAPTMFMVGSQLLNFAQQKGGCTGLNMFYPPGGLVFHKKNILEAAMAPLNKQERKVLEKYINKAMDKAMAIFEKILIDSSPKMAAEMRTANKKLLEYFQQKGMNIYIPTAEEREIWKKTTRPLWDKLAGKVYSREILDQVLKAKEEYRAANPDEFKTYTWVP